MKNYIAERRLLYSLKGSHTRKEFIIRIGVPYAVENIAGSPVVESCAGCHVEIEGLDEKYSEVYGGDSIQAIHLASNIDPFLERLRKKYDLYWLSGEPYFETSNEV
jgi:hypothetical protein